MTKHLCVPIKRWWQRRWLCIHCGAVGKQEELFDQEGCTWTPEPHDPDKCLGRYCTCPCNFCRKFPFGDQ